MYDDTSELLDEVRLVIHRSVAVIDKLHADGPVTTPMRAVLEYLRRHGPHTVSGVARARGVSRQHIQIIVNDLLAADLVERVANPNHVRAPLMALTESGVDVIDAMQARERDALEPVLGRSSELTSGQIRGAIDVLRVIRGELDGVLQDVSRQESS